MQISQDFMNLARLQVLDSGIRFWFYRADGDYSGVKVMLRTASPGTEVIGGGAVRIILEMVGVENALGKQLGSNNTLDNAKATVMAVQQMRQFSEVARDVGSQWKNSGNDQNKHLWINKLFFDVIVQVRYFSNIILEDIWLFLSVDS